jgi:hypothetical protein
MRCGWIFLLMLGAAARAESVPTPQQTAADMRKLASEMQLRAAQLKDDTAHAQTAAEGRALDQKLRALIARLTPTAGETSPEAVSTSPLGRNARTATKLQNDDEAAAASPSSTDPQPNRVSNSNDEWNKLPPAKREEILQLFRDDLPERWRKRLQAYYLSLTAEPAVPSKQK